MTSAPFTNWMRGTTVVLLSLVTVFNILGGIGGICVSFGTEKYKPAVPYIPFQHIYQPATLTILVVGFLTMLVAYAFLRGERWAMGSAIGLVIISAIATYVKMHYSIQIRGSSAPGNVRFYIDVVTLIFLLVMMIPAIYRRIDWTRPLGNFSSYSTPGGVALLASGLITLTSPWWAGQSHTIAGVNYAREVWVPLVSVGGSMFLAGGLILIALRRGVDLDAVVASGLRRLLGVGAGPEHQSAAPAVAPERRH